MLGTCPLALGSLGRPASRANVSRHRARWFASWKRTCWEALTDAKMKLRRLCSKRSCQMDHGRSGAAYLNRYYVAGTGRVRPADWDLGRASNSCQVPECLYQTCGVLVVGELINLRVVDEQTDTSHLVPCHAMQGVRLTRDEALCKVMSCSAWCLITFCCCCRWAIRFAAHRAGQEGQLQKRS